MAHLLLKHKTLSCNHGFVDGLVESVTVNNHQKLPGVVLHPVHNLVDRLAGVTVGQPDGSYLGLPGAVLHPAHQLADSLVVAGETAVEPGGSYLQLYGAVLHPAHHLADGLVADVTVEQPGRSHIELPGDVLQTAPDLADLEEQENCQLAHVKQRHL